MQDKEVQICNTLRMGGKSNCKKAINNIKEFRNPILAGVFILFFFISEMVATCQNFLQERSFLFSIEEIARIDITIDPDSFRNILEGDLSSDNEYPADFKMTRGTVIKEVKNVGFRLRGNTSRNSYKKSFKISINSFIPGKSFENVEKINLNGEHNDPSISRAKICWDLFQDMGVPSPRANHVELYINEEYRGLYLNVEHIDENFAEFWFQNNDGNLYKCLWPADLNFLGLNPDEYKYSQDGRTAYDLTRNEEADDYSDLVNFIDILNNTPYSDLPEYLEPVFNVNSYLKNLVVEIMTGHWDAYSFNKNNFYLYHNLLTGKFEFIPYDPDNTFGIDWFGIDWALRDIYNWSSNSQERPLYENIMQNEVYRNRFSFYTDRFITNFFSSEVIGPKLDSLREKIAPYTENDYFRTIDYNYSYDDFYNSFETATGGHVKNGIKPYIEMRNQSAREQLEQVNIAPIISRVSQNKAIPGENIIISALVEDEEPASEVILYYNKGQGNTGVQMVLNGVENYTITLPAFSGIDKLNYHIEAKDNLSQITREPYLGEYVINFLTTIPENLTEVSTFKIFPNPFSSFLFFSYPGKFDRISYRIANLAGQIISCGEISQPEIRIATDQEKFSPGMYFFQIDVKNIKGEVINREYCKIIFNK